MAVPTPTDPLTAWTPRAAVGLDCAGCHPGRRDDTSPLRPDAPDAPDGTDGTAPGERAEARGPAEARDDAAPPAAPGTPAAMTDPDPPRETP
jgi:hypothetical protein